MNQIDQNDEIKEKNSMNSKQEESNDHSEISNEIDNEKVVESSTNSSEGENLNELEPETELEREIAPTESESKTVEFEMKELHKNLIEGALYASGRPLDIEEISTKLEFPKKEVEELVNQLAFDYLERSSALIIAQVGDRFQMQLRPEYTEQVSKFAKGGGISEAHLRTLTVIALKQPILKSTVVKVRGTGAYEHVKYLLDNDLISAVKKGRTHELTTTDKYADMFGLPKNKQELKKMMISQLGLEKEGDQ